MLCVMAPEARRCAVSCHVSTWAHACVLRDRLLPPPEGPGKSDGLKEGETLVTNHPVAAGGSHLPDITVITPVWEGGRIVFFVASRGHHADVGGISPGSMPPNSKTLAEEGATIVSFKLVCDGVFQARFFARPSLEGFSYGGVASVGRRCVYLSSELHRCATCTSSKRHVCTLCLWRPHVLQ